MIEVFNLHEDTWEGRGYYIGRPSVLGNPFLVGRDGSREEVIELFRRWLWQIIKAGREGRFANVPPVSEGYVVSCLRRKLVDDECYQRAVWETIVELQRRAATGNLNLLCYCKPLPCHGEVIQRCLEWLGKDACTLSEPVSSPGHS